MRKTIKSLILLLFFIANFVCFAFFSNIKKPDNTYAFEEFFYQQKKLANEKVFHLKAGAKTFRFASSQFLGKFQMTEMQEKLAKNPGESINLLLNFGLEKQEIVKYLCPESTLVLEKIKAVMNKSETQGKVLVNKNKCSLDIVSGKEGTFVNEQKFYNDIFELLKSNRREFNIKLKLEKFKNNQDLNNLFKEKSCFSTRFQTSSSPRKNNIRRATAMFDGLILEEGEILSFNKTTGERTEKTGYEAAKIISGGTFTEGFGGGVCQVSTTLYNACLLAGLEILEVHNHSLPVSYVEPSFDAMVNSGSSDLVVRNNSGGRIIFTSSTENDVCKIKIFGLKNKYKITRFSEKFKTIPAEPEIIETDYKKYGDFELADGEEKRLSYAKDGFYSKGYLNFYDQSGTLVETKLIRENKYNATKGIIIKNAKAQP